MERFRQEAHFQAAKEAAREKGKEGSDRVVLEAAYQKALETETDQIQVEDFVDVYGKKQIQEQAKEVERLRAIFDHRKESPEMAEVHQLGKILEAIVIEQIELNEWLGPNIDTQQTCEYDDYVNGIDFITEFNEDGALRHMGFAIDATHGKEQAIRLKLEKIRSQLNKGELGEMTYFQTGDKSIQGKKRFIPKIVLALEKQHVIDIARLWVQGNQTALAEHPVKQTIMKEITDQLAGQLEYARALEAVGNPKAAKLVEVLSAQLEAMQRTAAQVGASKIQYVDRGAETIGYSVKDVFASENIGRMDELELELKIAKKRKMGFPTFDLQDKLRKLKEQKTNPKLAQNEVGTTENKVADALQQQAAPEKQTKHLALLEQHRLLKEQKRGEKEAQRMAMEKQIAEKEARKNAVKKFITSSSREELLTRYKELLMLRDQGDKTGKEEIDALNKEFTRLNALKKQEEIAAKVAKNVSVGSENREQGEVTRIAPTKKELVARYESLVQQRKQGDMSVDPEIKFLAKEFERLKELNRAKAALEQRAALEKKTKQNLAV